MVKGSPWDHMAKWAVTYGTIYKLHLFGSDAYVVSDPELLKIVLQTKLSIFKKDVDWTYKPFMVLLGNGLVTAEGANWRKQRNLLSSHLRLGMSSRISSLKCDEIRFRCFLQLEPSAVTRPFPSNTIKGLYVQSTSFLNMLSLVCRTIFNSSGSLTTYASDPNR